MAEDLSAEPVDGDIVDLGHRLEIALGERDALRAEVERLKKLEEKAYIDHFDSQMRERRYIEALEKIAEERCDFEHSGGAHGAGVADGHRCAAKIAKEALSPAPVTETVYGPTEVCSEHGVMKERCKCPQEAEAKGCVCSGGAVVHRTDGPCYHAKSGDYIPKEMMK